MLSQLFLQYPRASDEHVPLSHHGGASALSSGLLVDTNLDTSIPDTYRPPPTPMPYDVALGRPQTPPVAQEICSNKSDAAVQTTNSNSVEEIVGGNTQETLTECEDLKESERKLQTNIDLDSAKDSEVELSKSVEAVFTAMEEEDGCPVCLEGNVLIVIFFFNKFYMVVGLFIAALAFPAAVLSSFASNNVTFSPLCFK